ncbi:MAG TPA: hypothetical protein VNT92_01145 [Acidimicrobiia bacterium]|nr:hypothetical protein [Acidimicrobiia bacterium]
MSDGRNDGTATGLLEFLEWAARTGEMNQSTARAWAAAVRQVLGSDADLDALDVRHLDVEAQLERFTTLNRTNYSPQSMKTYHSRFRTAVAAYTAWLDNEPWKPGKRAVRPTENPPATKPKGAAHGSFEFSGSASGVVGRRLMNYTLPLRPDLMVTLSLPVDLTTKDAERIATFIRSVAFDSDSSPASKAGHESDEGA